METPTTFHKHPLHPMLVAIPIGLWLFALVCDVASLFSDNPTWSVVAFYAIAGGIVGAVLAAIPGVIDLTSLRAPHVKRMALAHMALNLTVTVLFAISLGMRLPDMAAPAGAAVALAALGVVLLLVSGWLGGEMVHVHRVGVTEPGAMPAPSPPPVTGERRVNRQDRRRAGGPTWAH